MKKKNILLIAAICLVSNVACAQFTTTLSVNSPGCIYTLEGTFNAVACSVGSAGGSCSLQKYNDDFAFWEFVSSQSYSWNCGSADIPHTFSFTIYQPHDVSGTYRLHMMYTYLPDCVHDWPNPCNYYGTDGQTYPITFYDIPKTCFTINGISGCYICNCAALPATGNAGSTSAIVDISCSAGDLYYYSYVLTQVNNTNCGFIATASSGGGQLFGATSFPITGLVAGNDYMLRVTLANHCLNSDGSVVRGFHWGKVHRMEPIEEVGISLGDMELYPNPTQGIIQMENIPTFDNLNVSLINSLGQTVNINNLFNKDLNSVNLDQYPDGIYTIVFENSGERVTKRVVLLK